MKPRCFWYASSRSTGDRPVTAIATRSRRLTAVPFQELRNDVHMGHGAWRCGPYIMPVDQQRLFVAEQRRQANGTFLEDKLEVPGNLAACRKRPPLRGHTLDVATELNLFDKERVASRPVFGALVGKAGLVGIRKLSSGSERVRITHKSSADQASQGRLLRWSCSCFDDEP